MSSVMLSEVVVPDPVRAATGWGTKSATEERLACQSARTPRFATGRGT